MSIQKPIKHFLQFSDFTLDEFEYVIERAAVIKRKFKNYEVYHPLIDRTLVMVFEKNSTRTRLSFEAGMHQLGGAAIYLNTRDSQLGRGEPVEDAGQVMSRMCDIIMVRTFGQEIIERFAANSRVPVINGLTNEHHPCQVLADIFTYYEHRGSITGKTVAWVGDANNMLYSWLQAAEVFGFHLNVSTRRATTSTCRWCRPSATPSSTTRPTPAPARTWSTPTCGPAWATKRKTPRA
jgi:ornithine carbamoyltransferase